MLEYKPSCKFNCTVKRLVASRVSSELGFCLVCCLNMGMELQIIWWNMCAYGSERAWVVVASLPGKDDF